jgi:hypothetical protein
MKSFIRLDGRWYNVTIIDVYEQADLFGGMVKMVRFKKSKNSVEVLEARRDQFVDAKPKTSKRKAEEYQS